MEKDQQWLEDMDVTRLYLKRVLDRNAPALQELHDNFERINIDRVIQSFIDATVEPPDKAKDNPSSAVFFAGQMDMAMRFKKFFCNLNTISSALAEGDLDIDSASEIIENSIISQNDYDLVRR